MPQNIPQEINLSFQPGLSLLRISQRRLRKVLGWLIFVFLILFGFFGLFVLVLFPEYSSVFYLSLLTDMFVFYLWQRRKEKVRKIWVTPKTQPKQDEPIEVSLFLDKSAQESLEKAWLFCYRKRYHSLRPIHLLAIFLKRKDFKKILARLDCHPKDVVEKTKSILAGSSLFSEKAKEREDLGVQLPKRESDSQTLFGPKIAADFKEVFFKAYYFCLRKGSQQISSLDILWGISQQKNLVGMIFDEFGISSEEIERVVEWTRLEKQIKQWEKSFFWPRFFKPKGKLDRAMIAALTPALDRVSRDLTMIAKRGGTEMVVGRQKEIEKIFNFFSAGRTGVILVGQTKIGKVAILKRLAQLMVTEEVPKFLRDKRLIQLDLSGLVSLDEADQRGEEYLKKIIAEVSWAGNIVLVIENIDNLAGLKSQESGLDFAEILASSLEGKEIFFIGTASPEGFSSKIEGKILGQVLNKIEVELPPKDLLWRILITKIFIIERELKIIFSADALERAIDLADRYVYGKALPAKVMDLLAEVGYSIKQQKGPGSLIKGDDVIELVAQKTKVPLGQVQQTEKDKLLQMEELIHQRIINQEEAVKAVAAALRRSRLELQEQEGTIANFLFVGPTGVGKTELAKTLARVYFGDEKRMIRLDMSEYQEKRSLRRLIGLRTDEGISRGYLTEAIKRQPYSLLLLDEIEKSHPDILNVFLQLMDDGRLTDASGEVINFTNVLLIATSNAGTQFIQEKIRQRVKYDEIYKQLKEKVLLDYFRPEFLNRFDKIVLFKALSMDNVVAITNLFLKMFREKLEDKGVDFEATEEAVKELALAGFDPLYGARPLKRVIQEKVENIVARLFLEDKVSPRDKLILKKGLVFEIKKGPKL